jgi:DNA mismatch repair protein MutL
MTIKLLSQNLINQIAAGEVIERPASVIKELLENSIDAKATEIEVTIMDAGKSFISVSDNGEGMDRESLELCTLSHATSKLSSENLFDIYTLGFRGEALPSIASISRLSITSATAESEKAWSLKLEGGQNLGLSPAIRKNGTTIEVRDLFFATPARLKFLKSNDAETDNCRSVFDRIAMAFSKTFFKFIDSNKEKTYKKTDDLQTRIKEVLGDSFMENTFEVNASKDGLQLRGFIGVPTFNKASANHQYFFVNNRFVKDKIFASALKFVYAGLVPQGRYPVAILYMDIPSNQVDVNAHPAKTEVRFRDAEKVRLFISFELKKSLDSFGARRSTAGMFENYRTKQLHGYTHKAQGEFKNKEALEEEKFDQFVMPKGKFQKPELNQTKCENFDIPQSSSANPTRENICLGEAVCQINRAYIIASDEDNLIIVDQHAAAERITLESLKDNLSLDSQVLLLPEICPMTVSQVELLENHKKLMLKFGIFCEKLADDLVVVNSLPAILETCDAKSLIYDVVDELLSFSETFSLDEKIHRILSTISCHGSLRAGKKLSIFEMNSLLRRMEKSKNIAQCCHGRPSYIALSIKNLNKLFERS